jgi:hypothetical protein
MIIVFGTLEIEALRYYVYPPFGIIAEAFMPLGAYFLFIGVYTSALSISQDRELRREFYKSAKSQFTFLKTIGVTQMERELVNKFKAMEKQAFVSGETEEAYHEEEDVKKIVREVLNELSKNKSKNEK